GRAEARDQLPGEAFHRRRLLLIVRIHDLNERGEAERRDPEEAAAEGDTRLAFERYRIKVEENEAARHRAFARLGRPLEDERVGRIEPDGAQQFHARGPPVWGSSQEGTASAVSRRCSFTSSLPLRRTKRSPTLSMVRSLPDSAGSRVR